MAVGYVVLTGIGGLFQSVSNNSGGQRFVQNLRQVPTNGRRGPSACQVCSVYSVVKVLPMANSLFFDNQCLYTFHTL